MILISKTIFQDEFLLQEKLYTDNDYPKMLPGMANLEKSPLELGMSRADLWAFAGVLALGVYLNIIHVICCKKIKQSNSLISDETLSFTKVACQYGNEQYGIEYKDKKDKYEECYVQFGIHKMFKTGRKDCQPKSGNKLYLASKVENHPAIGFNGSMTIDYFKDDFGLDAKSAVAIMGTHTIGSFNPIVTQ